MRGLKTLAAMALGTALLAGPVQGQEENRPKFGQDAIPITRSIDYLRRADAPDYWVLSHFYVPQATGSACSLASLVMMLNALRGLPEMASERLITQNQLLNALDDEQFRAAVADSGDGISFSDLAIYARRALDAYDIDADVEVFRPRDDSPQTLAELRRILSANERSADDIIIAAFDQGILTGDQAFGHISPIGAYDAERKRVLVMDVDRAWYVPYWTSDAKLLEAMLKPDRADPEGSGLIRIRRRHASG